MVPVFMVYEITIYSSENQALKPGLIQKYLMEQLISDLENSPNYKDGLRDACRSNKIAVTVLNGLTIKRLRAVYNRTLKHYEINPDKARVCWFQNQLRLFHWILIIESFFLNKGLNQFTNNDWATIQIYFPLKSLSMFQFQAKKLLGTTLSSYSRSWLSQECQILQKIMEDKSLFNRWNEVSRRFYELSEKKFYRTSKQCRQQWFNHLDHSKIHGQWDDNEDRTILEFVLKNGRKWALMCKQLLPHRTEHMIKNRFKSLMVKGREHSKRQSDNERRLIKKILQQYRSKENQKDDEFIIKKTACHQTFRLREQEDKGESNISFSQNRHNQSLSGQLNKINQFNNIKQQLQKQNNEFLRSQISPPVPHSIITPTTINLNKTPTFNSLHFINPQQFSDQNLPFFSFNSICPNYVTFLNPSTFYFSIQPAMTLESLQQNFIQQ